MNWLIIIPLIGLVLPIIIIIIIDLSRWNLFFQVLYVFIGDHENWKRYRRLKKYLKNNIIPIIDIRDYEGNNSGFAFVQYDSMIFIIQGDNIYLSTYYNHLIKDLLKHNNQ